MQEEYYINININTSQNKVWCFSVSLLPGKFTKLNLIKEANNINAPGQHDTMIRIKQIKEA